MHIPVLAAEVIEGLQVRPGGSYIDGTLGGGGHTEAILAASAPNGRVLGLDADTAAIERVRTRLAESIAANRLSIHHANFSAMAQIAQAQNFAPVDGILLDLGVSSFQFDTAERGFSLLHDGPLDMRMDPEATLTAAEIVNHWPQEELAAIFYEFGEERKSRRIARAIVNSRPLTGTAELAETVSKAVGGRRGARIHPATRVFQALRIAVNQELTHLTETLPQCLELLQPGGRLAVISFHSLEDRIVKRWMQDESRTFIPDPVHPMGGYEHTPTLQVVTRKPIAPEPAELESNPRSRSAKLRIAEKIAA